MPKVKDGLVILGTILGVIILTIVLGTYFFEETGARFPPINLSDCRGPRETKVFDYYGEIGRWAASHPAYLICEVQTVDTAWLETSWMVVYQSHAQDRGSG